jgi:hypothetical protein
LEVKRGVTGLGVAFAVVALAACGEASTPKWLVDNGRTAKVFYFGAEAKPTRVTYVLGKRAGRVVYEFDGRVACRGCSNPGSGNPSGRFAAAVFDRGTHRLLEFKLCPSRETCVSDSRPVRPPPKT